MPMPLGRLKLPITDSDYQVPAAASPARSGTIDPVEVIDWEGTEAGPVDFAPRPVTGRRRRPWAAAAAVLALPAIVLVNLGGVDAPSRAGTAARSDGGDAITGGSSIRLTAPADGDAIDGCVIGIDGTANGPMRIQLGAVVGDTALGMTSVDVSAAGRIHLVLPIFAPPVRMGVDLVALAAPPGASAVTSLGLARTATTRRHLVVRPSGPVGFWPASLVPTDDGIAVVVSGCAPLALGGIALELVTGDGRVLATAGSAVMRDETQPGSAGGQALGVGSFVARLATSAANASTGLHVVADWRDDSAGSWGTSVLSLDDLVRPNEPARLRATSQITPGAVTGRG